MAPAAATRSLMAPAARLAISCAFSTTPPLEPEMEELELVFDPLPPDALRRYLTDPLDSQTIAATGLSEWHPVNFFLKNARGEWLGGLLGDLWGGWLHVRILWVDAAV